MDWIPEPNEKFLVEPADISGYRVRSQQSRLIWAFFDRQKDAITHQRALEKAAREVGR